MTGLFKDPAFRERWQKMQEEDPEITLQDFILIINDHQLEERLLAESRKEARQRRKAERRAAREDFEASNDPLLKRIMARRKANPSSLKREGTFISYKIADLDNSYRNADNRIIRDSHTNISLC